MFSNRRSVITFGLGGPLGDAADVGFLLGGMAEL
jgi:hypothetical protein